MKIFNWSKCKLNDHRMKWLQQNQSKTLSEEQFVKGWQSFRDFSRAKHKGSNNSPSRARGQYRNLKKNFGFFT